MLLVVSEVTLAQKEQADEADKYARLIIIRYYLHQARFWCKQ